MPGARSVITVVTMLTPPRIVPRPATARPMIHRSVPAPGEFTLVGQRRVERPADVGRAARGEEAGHRHQRAEQVQPVRERVQPRERDVGRADLQRQHQVGEREHDRRREEQQHDRAVHREQLVVLLRRQELHARTGQLGAHQQRHHAADGEERERRDQVHPADHLVIGRAQHPPEQRALLELRDRERARDDRLGTGAVGAGCLGRRPLCGCRHYLQPRCSDGSSSSSS